MNTDYRNIHYLFTTPKKFKLFSWLIKKRLNTNYSHVCIAVWINTLQDWRIYQASRGDVNTVLLSNFKKHNKIIGGFTDTVTKDEWKNAVVYAEKQTGKKYSILGALAATVKAFRDLKIGDNDDQQHICSELAYRIKGQYSSGYSDNADYIDPKDFEIMNLEKVKIGVRYEQ